MIRHSFNICDESFYTEQILISQLADTVTALHRSFSPDSEIRIRSVPSAGFCSASTLLWEVTHRDNGTVTFAYTGSGSQMSNAQFGGKSFKPFITKNRLQTDLGSRSVILVSVNISQHQLFEINRQIAREWFHLP